MTYFWIGLGVLLALLGCVVYAFLTNDWSK